MTAASAINARPITAPPADVTTAPAPNSSYVAPAIERLADGFDEGVRVLDVGCGRGWLAGQLAQRGCVVVGLDFDPERVEQARTAWPSVRFETHPITPDVLERLGEDPFDIVVSTEVVEHVFSPRAWAEGCFGALRPGGQLICSTPYHGYFKNLMLSLGNRWDHHFTPLWEGGHIKFWSPKTLSWLLRKHGFEVEQVRGAGRFPRMWKSMVISARKPRVHSLDSETG